jgi:hypothetical protein
MNNSSEVTDKVNMQIAYLNILQNIINRMSTFGIAMQTASVTTLTALLAYASTNTDTLDTFRIWMFFIPWLFFARYNAFFLRTERAFRERYNQIAMKNTIDFTDFKIDKTDLKSLYSTKECQWFNVIFSKVFITCHLVIFLVIILFAYSKGISCF